MRRKSTKEERLKFFRKKYVGLKKAKLRIIDIVINDKNVVKFVVLCDCGKTIEAERSSWRNIKSCGCVRTYHSLRNEELIGETYGSFKIVGFEEEISRHFTKRRLKLICDNCGRISYRSGFSLMKGFRNHPSALCRPCGTASKVIISPKIKRLIDKTDRKEMTNSTMRHPLYKYALSADLSIFSKVPRGQRIPKLLKIIEKVPNYENGAYLFKINPEKPFVAENLYWRKHRWIIEGHKNVFDYPREKTDLRNLLRRQFGLDKSENPLVLGDLIQVNHEDIDKKYKRRITYYKVKRNSGLGKKIIRYISEKIVKNGGVA